MDVCAHSGQGPGAPKAQVPKAQVPKAQVPKAQAPKAQVLKTEMCNGTPHTMVARGLHNGADHARLLTLHAKCRQWMSECTGAKEQHWLRHHMRLTEENLGYTPTGKEDIDAIAAATPEPVQQAMSFWTTAPFERPRQRHILHQLAHYFTDAKLRRVVLPIVPADRHGLEWYSCRVVEWLVTNYSKQNNVVYEWSPTPGWPTEIICLYDAYQARLGATDRYQFDVYCRGQHIYFMLDGVTYSTTVAQLHFLHWADKVGALHYLQTHLDAVSASNKLHQAKRRREKKEQGDAKKKRRPLTSTPAPNCQVFMQPVDFKWI